MAMRTQIAKPGLAPPAKAATIAGNGPVVVPPGVREILSAPGHSLDTRSRAFVEPRFGHDFSRVRIHSDARAAEAAAAIDARAFTVNHDVVFGAGEYAPHTEPGRRLLLHELAHVVQQRAGARLRPGVSRVGDEHERHADAIAERVMQGGSAAPLFDGYRYLASERAPFAVQRAPTPTSHSSDRSDSVGDQTEESGSTDPLVLTAAVGAKGENRIEDVAKVQARLRAVGLLSEEDAAAESPVTSPTVTPAGVVPADSVAAPTVAAPAVATSEASLSKTIAAIRELQHALFSSDTVDGNVGPTGPTWRFLRTADAASFAAMNDAWNKKQQQKREEKARKLQSETERKKLEASQKSARMDKLRTALADNLLARYATYLPFTSVYINLDESGLAGALAGYAKTQGAVVLRVFDALHDADADDVAYELASAAPDKDLAAVDPAVLARLRSAMTSGLQTEAETKQIHRIDAVLGADVVAVKNSGPVGALSWPVDAAGAVVTSCYGWRMLSGKRNFHPGLDIAKSEGSPVYAAAAGTVIRAKPVGGYGPNFVAIQHTPALVTSYGHMSSKQVEKNDPVVQGTQIGAVGHEGLSVGHPGDHLHFNVTVGEKPSDHNIYNGNVDPLKNGLSIPAGVPNDKNCD